MDASSFFIFSQVIILILISTLKSLMWMSIGSWILGEGIDEKELWSYEGFDRWWALVDQSWSVRARWKGIGYEVRILLWYRSFPVRHKELADPGIGPVKNNEEISTKKILGPLKWQNNKENSIMSSSAPLKWVDHMRCGLWTWETWLGWSHFQVTSTSLASAIISWVP